MSLVKEDWERVFLTDKIYLQQVEYKKQLKHSFEQKPAEIVILTPIIKKNKNESLPF